MDLPDLSRIIDRARLRLRNKKTKTTRPYLVYLFDGQRDRRCITINHCSPRFYTLPNNAVCFLPIDPYIYSPTHKYLLHLEVGKKVKYICRPYFSHVE